MEMDRVVLFLTAILFYSASTLLLSCAISGIIAGNDEVPLFLEESTVPYQNTLKRVRQNLYGWSTRARGQHFPVRNIHDTGDKNDKKNY